jgi:hypothetical protein
MAIIYLYLPVPVETRTDFHPLPDGELLNFSNGSGFFSNVPHAARIEKINANTSLYKLTINNEATNFQTYTINFDTTSIYSESEIKIFYNVDQAITPGVYTSEQQPPPVTTTATASAGGDPYVYPMSGPPVKLPNMSASYRLYQDSAYIVNGRVSRASERTQSEINSVVEHTGLQAVSSEAFFFSVLRTIHVPSGEWFEIDLESKRTNMSSPDAKAMFGVGELELQNTHYAFEPDCDKGRSHVSFPIRLGTSTTVHIMFSRNPQVRNGLSLTTSTTNADGLLLRNYRPKLFQITSHVYDKPVSIPTGYRRVLTKRGVAGHQEKLMKIRVTCK